MDGLGHFRLVSTLVVVPLADKSTHHVQEQTDLYFLTFYDTRINPYANPRTESDSNISLTMLLSSNLALILTQSLASIKLVQAGPPFWLSGTYPKVGDGVPSLLRRKISDSNSHPQVLADIHNLAGCPGEICGTLSGDAVTPLLAGAGECAQQDMADKMIDIAKSKLQDTTVRNKLIELAKIYRQTERNTFPDFSLPSSPDRNSLYCQKAPKNSELSGLVQKQSSNADPKLFFDPKANGKSIREGSDPRTIPFGQSTGNGTSGSNGANDDDNALKTDDSSRNQKNSGERTSSSNDTNLRNDDDQDHRAQKKQAKNSNPSNKPDEDDDDDENDEVSKENDESTQAASKATVPSSDEDRSGENRTSPPKQPSNAKEATQKSVDSKIPKDETDESSEKDKPVAKSNKKKDRIGKCHNKRRARRASR